MYVDFKDLILNLLKLKNNLLIQMLILFIIIDIITGITKGIKEKQLNSKYGISGIITHSIVMILILITWIYSLILNHEYIATYLNVFFICYL